MKNAKDLVASNIKTLLSKQSMTVERLAHEINMSKGFLSEFLSGKKDITITNLERIAKGLDVDINELFK